MSRHLGRNRPHGLGGPIRVEAKVERKSPTLPRFVVIPAADLAPWVLDATTVVEVRLDGHAVGRRSLKRWPERDGWFFDLTEAQTRSVGVEVGDRVAVELVRAPNGPPAELREALAATHARGAWEALTDARRRMLSEHVRDAKRVETRRRRSSRIVSDLLDGD